MQAWHLQHAQYLFVNWHFTVEETHVKNSANVHIPYMKPVLLTEAELGRRPSSHDELLSLSSIYGIANSSNSLALEPNTWEHEAEPSPCPSTSSNANPTTLVKHLRKMKPWNSIKQKQDPSGEPRLWIRMLNTPGPPFITEQLNADGEVGELEAQIFKHKAHRPCSV